jgi:hypothetical protein
MHYDAALQRDPGVFRRLDLELPVKVRSDGGDVASEAMALVTSSPRFSSESSGLAIRVQATSLEGRMCLSGSSTGAVIGCTQVKRKVHQDSDEFARVLNAKFHEDVFAPRVELSQSDANSLDGSNRVARNPLDTVLGDPKDSLFLDE